MACLMSAVYFVYVQTVEYSLVWDDHVLTTAAVYSEADLARIITSPANGYEFLPVRDLSLVLDYANYGGWYGGFHQTNVTLFLIAVLLAFIFYGLLFSNSDRGSDARNKSYLLAFLCVTVFALHPLNVEAVAFISARNALLALVFTVASLITVLVDKKTDSKAAYWVGFACLVLALFSKATSIFIPLALVLLDMHINKSSDFFGVAKKYSFHIFVTAFILVVHVSIASGGAIQGQISLLGIAGKLYNLVFVPEFYLFKFIWPFDLVVDYPVAEYLQRKVVLLVASAFFVWAVVSLYLRGKRDRNVVWFFLLAYFAALLPVMNLLPTTPQVADRYAQIPLLFLSPLVLLVLSARIDIKVLSVLVVVSGVGLGALSYKQVQVWESDLSLFGHTISSNPASVKAMYNLGSRLWIEGDKRKALEYFERANKIAPEKMAYQYYLGRYEEERGDIQAAVLHYTKATKLEGELLYLAYLKLGYLYEQLGEYRKAIEVLESAIELAGVSPKDQANKRSAILLRDRIKALAE